MTKLERIAEMEKQLAELKKQVEEEKPVKRWRGEREQFFYIVEDTGSICKYRDFKNTVEEYLYSIGNYFKTEQEAKDHRRRLLIEQQIKDIALRLNDGKEIDWKDTEQDKYFIGYDRYSEKFYIRGTVTWQESKIYCLSDKFLKTVLDEVGEEDLKFYYGVEK